LQEQLSFMGEYDTRDRTDQVRASTEIDVRRAANNNILTEVENRNQQIVTLLVLQTTYKQS
jgi:hypothetical protein